MLWSSIGKSWDVKSKEYQATTRISTDDVHYGPLGPGENVLKLLGNVKRMNVLELGCGGGQNAIALAKRGANVSGLDVSAQQLAFARSLAQKEGVKVGFYRRSMENLAGFRDSSFDVVVSSFAIQYARNLAKTIREAARVLRPGGLFVFCTNHPVTTTGRPLPSKSDGWLIRDYFQKGARWWRWRSKGGLSVPFRQYHRTIQHYFDALVAAGLTVERLIEPQPLAKPRLKASPCVPTSMLAEYRLWCSVPYTIIFKARKTKL